jgi:N-acetylmuramoyl-L-alanine amidase
VLDAAHGDQQTGTILSPQVYEKDVVLALSIHLRSALNARGIAVVTTREGDTDPSLVTRAGEANHARAAACLVLHATATGSGVHLYTSSSQPSSSQPAASPGSSPRLIPWSKVGLAYTTQSLQLSSDLGAAFSSAGLPYTLGRVRLPLLDSMACPTVAVEVAPLHPSPGHNKSSTLADPDYQQQLVDAMAAALIAWRADWQNTHAGGQPAPGPAAIPTQPPGEAKAGQVNSSSADRSRANRSGDTP